MNQVTDEQEEAVIGRMQIDNYLMSVMRKDWPTLATTTTTTTFSTTTVSELVDATVVGRRKGNDNEEEDVICSNRNS